ncbi:MAG: EF-P lysine aminoacylase GenX [Alphaproteobacteria bacterium]|nr:EF-P lysine aminoacylase GenX [Alphaproteobacteria bacterium]
MTETLNPSPWWRPDQFARRRPMLDKRQHALRAVRGYFESQGFAEVETPALQVSPGNETHLHAFKTQFTDYLTRDSRDYYLHTSPEFAMKKLLVAGMPKIFQIARAFRNGERSSRHHPEFSMLEWYRAGAGLPDIMQDCVALVRAAAAACGVTNFTAQGLSCDPFGAWESLTVSDAFRRYANIDLMATIGDTAALRAQMTANNIRATESDTWDDLFFRALGEHIEPRLGDKHPVFLCDYPVHMAALARPKRGDARLAERFELYICGYEIANAFDELTDAGEQARRFAADMDEKEKLYGERYPVDADFIAALHHGMPDSAGIALGFDRLVMLCAGTENIDDVLWVPVA